MGSIKEKLRKGILYPIKLLRTFGLSGSIRFVAAYRRRDEFVQLKPRGYPGKVWLRPGASDIRVVYEFFTCGELTFDWPFPEPPSRVIDAGANVGYATLAIKQRWPACEVVALEPDEANYVVLTRNCQGLQGVRLLKKGLWSEGCALRVEAESRALGAWALRFEPCSPEESGAVSAVSVEEILNDQNWKTCDLLKMDIEGAEVPVLRNRSAWLDRVRSILVEPHGDEASALVRETAEGQNLRPEGEKFFIWRA